MSWLAQNSHFCGDSEITQRVGVGALVTKTHQIEDMSRCCIMRERRRRNKNTIRKPPVLMARTNRSRAHRRRP
jgi:hypothetical protein